VNVRKYGLNIDQLELLITAKNRLEKLNLNESQVKETFDNVEAFCYKQGIAIERFFKKVIRLARKTNVPVEDLAYYIERKSEELSSLETEIMLKNMEEKVAQQALKLVVNQIGDIKTLYDKVQLYHSSLAFVTNQRNEAYAEISRLKNLLNSKVFAYGYPQGNPPNGLFM
jgi:hypothetical protein